MGFRVVVAAMTALAFTACGSGVAEKEEAPIEGDAFIGNPDAEIVLMEYGAPTCPACKGWHDAFWSDIKADYVDTNKIKFVFRVLPSHNPPVDAAIGAIARCSGATEFFSVLDDAFEKQVEIERAAVSGEATKALHDLGGRHGLSPDAVDACIKDPASLDLIFTTQDQAEKDRVSGTPTFFINGAPVADPRLPALSAQLDAALAAHAASADSPADSTDTSPQQEESPATDANPT